jgi:MinD-like ATPase involved in chromosome partitioning or flagellar assembly
MKSITFYSFKGGTGRTTIAANLSTQLAIRGFNTSIIDFDIFSSGLARLFPNLNPGDYLQNIIADSLENYSEIAENNRNREILLEEYFRDINFQRTIYDYRNTINNIFNNFYFREGGNIYIIPSTDRILESEYRIMDDIISRRNVIDDFSMYRILFSILRRYQNILDENYKLEYFFIDSPSGLSDLAQTPLSISEYLIVVLTTDNQSLSGTTYFLNWVMNEYSRTLKGIYIIFNMVKPNIPENIIVDRYNAMIYNLRDRYIRFDFKIINELNVFESGEKILKQDDNGYSIFEDLTDSILRFINSD